MKKIILLICFLLVSTKGISQDPKLFRTWQLTKVTIDNVDYIPADYEYFPTLDLIEDNNEYYIGFAAPFKAYCSGFIENFQTNPNGFSIDQDNMACLAEVLCKGDPTNNPCVIIHGKHSEMYLEIVTILTYEITENPDKTFNLKINNTDGNSAYYSSVLLSNSEYLIPNISIFPNPTANTLSIIPENINIEQFSIFNLTGQKIIEIENLDNTIDVSSLQSGIYFLEIISEKGKAIKKFIKK